MSATIAPVISTSAETLPVAFTPAAPAPTATVVSPPSDVSELSNTTVNESTPRLRPNGPMHPRSYPNSSTSSPGVASLHDAALALTSDPKSNDVTARASTTTPPVAGSTQTAKTFFAPRGDSATKPSDLHSVTPGCESTPSFPSFQSSIRTPRAAPPAASSAAATSAVVSGFNLGPRGPLRSIPSIRAKAVLSHVSVRTHVPQLFPTLRYTPRVSPPIGFEPTAVERDARSLRRIMAGARASSAAYEICASLSGRAPQSLFCRDLSSSRPPRHSAHIDARPRTLTSSTPSPTAMSLTHTVRTDIPENRFSKRSG
mmetsp:Transcript_328/g.1534  ORF Transcript_328/g.1534 Transcript_328/m.1534 type:complete len:314 (+) Transcript_328:1456-2397(+)